MDPQLFVASEFGRAKKEAGNRWAFWHYSPACIPRAVALAPQTVMALSAADAALGGWCFSRVADPADVIAWDNDNDGFCCLSWESAMTLGLAPKRADLLHTTVSYCEARIGADSIYAVLNRECFTLTGAGCAR